MNNQKKRHSKKPKPTNNKNKKLVRLAKLHRKIQNKRKDFVKQTASAIAKLNDLVVVEYLNVKGMTKNHKLAKSIVDASFAMFITELQWQCQKRGKHFHKIDRWFPSSKTCNHCGHINNDLSLRDRDWICPQCKTTINRDYNAAKNILDKGIQDLQNNVNNTAGTAEIHAC